MAASSDPAALAEAFAELDADRLGVDLGRGGRQGGHPLGPAGRPADRAGGGLRQPAPALHRLGQAQRGAAHRGGAARPARERVRRSPTTRAATREAFATEEEVYERLGMQFIPPELRENRGELEAAREGRLPELIELDDIRGDLHMHTTLSDGHASVEEMASAARELGYEYIAITDHSATHGFGNDVQPDALLRRVEEIRALAGPGDHRARGHRERTSCPTARSTTTTTCSSSSTGSSRACTPRSGCRRRSRRSACCARWSTRSWTRSAIPPGG